MSDSNAPAACCAAFYELDITRLLLGTSFHPGGSELTRRLGQNVLLSRVAVVLDVASGRGESLAVLTDQFGSRGVGLDYSLENLAASRERGAGGRCAWLRAEAGVLPLADGCFDAVVCECALCTFADMPSAVGEMFRVLKPGGRLGISDMVLEDEIPEALRGVLGEVLCIAGAKSREGYAELFRSGGFVSIRHQDQRQALLQMVNDIERRLGVARQFAAAGRIALPALLDAAPEVLAAAKDFIGSGGLGYALITARKPRG